MFRNHFCSDAMSKHTSMQRRSFLKKSAAAVAMGGGILSSTQTAAAASPVATISGTGDYTLSENSGSLHTGSVSGGSEEVELEDYITTAALHGDMDVSIENVGNIANVGPELEVSGTNVSYGFGMSSDGVYKTSDCESIEGTTDDTGYGRCEGSDTDTFEVDGTITYLNSYSDGGITFRHLDW